MTRLLIALCCVAFALPSGVSAKMKRYTHQGPACELSWRYDTSKVSETVMTDMAFLVYEAETLPFISAGTVFAPQDIEKLDMTLIETECRDRKAKLEKLQVSSLKGAAERKAALLEQVEDDCNFARISAKGYTDPAILRSYSRAASCNRFVDAVESKEGLDKAWRDFIAEGCKENGDLEACTKRELARLDGQSDPDAVKRVYLLTFGWSNCANLTRLSSLPESDAQKEALKEVFAKTYKVKETCEEP